jgi:hypothetical protein
MLQECRDIKASSFYTFLQEDGFYRLDDKVTPWRTEAIINGEGHLQLTVHHELPNDEDFRFHFSINPDFRPRMCTTDSNNNPKVEYVDGSDWVSRWSESEDGHKIYYLNAGAYQLNPSDSDDYWYLINDWNSGFGIARFAGEEYASVPTWYGNYENDTSGFMYASNRKDIDLETYNSQIYGDEGTDYSEVPLNDRPFQHRFDTWSQELNNFSYELGKASDTTCAADSECGENQYCRLPTPLIEDSEGVVTENGTCRDYQFSHKTEDNLWRPVNSTNGGIDGWAEMNSSWVRIKETSNIEKGGTVSGDFQIVYQAMESSSRLMVKGSFKIDNLREDPWAYSFFEEDKRTENEANFCGNATLGE